MRLNQDRISISGFNNQEPGRSLYAEVLASKFLPNPTPKQLMTFNLEDNIFLRFIMGFIGLVHDP